VQRIRQRYALAVLYCEFNGDRWSYNELWLSELHECDWYNTPSIGAVDPCSRNEEYQIIISYGQAAARGSLPPELSMITTLWEISLSDHLITGTIPSDYAKLDQLDTIQLSFNLLTGPVPNFVWEFEDLTYFGFGIQLLHG
jgi:hypothetical protein